MHNGNTKYKQILIDTDNYESLKKMGQTGASFNQVIHKLIIKVKEGGKN